MNSKKIPEIGMSVMSDNNQEIVGMWQIITLKRVLGTSSAINVVLPYTTL